MPREGSLGDIGNVSEVSCEESNNHPEVRRGRNELNGTVAKREIPTRGVEGIKFTVVCTIHEAITARNERNNASGGGVVLETCGIGAIDAESAVDVRPSPSVCDDVQAKGRARPRIRLLSPADVHGWPSGTFRKKSCVGESVGDHRELYTIRSTPIAPTTSRAFREGRPAAENIEFRTALIDP